MNFLKRWICKLRGHRFERMKRNKHSHYTCSLRCSRCGRRLTV